MATSKTHLQQLVLLSALKITLPIKLLNHAQKFAQMDTMVINSPVSA